NTSFLGTLPDSIGTLENLTRVDLRSYNFTRPIPTSMANLAQLFHMDFSSNHFSGPIPSLHKSRNLNYLDLSSNNLNEIHLLSNNQFENQFPEISNMSSSFSKLRLASSKPWVIPILKNQSQLSFFYISNNQISGEIPNWIWEVGGVNLYFLNLSQNLLVSLQEPYHISGRTYSFSTINKSLIGFIPEYICKATYFQVLDLSNNNLSGSIPACLITKSSTTLGVLNLRRNNLGVVLKSLANCNMLQVLDLRNNHISDNFPCWLRNAFSLQVLVFRSNNFSERISCPRNNVSWPLLKIVDLASNKFSGRLSQKWLLTMMIIQLKIPNIFTSIDCSSNNFEGPMPEEMGRFKSLYAPNMSHNALKGSIPSSFGNLKQIESLDLLMNNLMGKIPTSTQLQSFLPTSYEGNKGLYIPPLTNDIQTHPPESQPLPPPASSNEIDWFFIAISIGFAVSFGAVVSPLMFFVHVKKWYNDLIYKFIYRRFR
ncbi:hypothetical protein CISIN_1g035547mg, partial [Citrus sinensis]